jgi:transposase
MYLRRCGKSSGRNKVYWELVESVRTERGPRQRVVAYLGSLSKPACDGIEIAAEDRCHQSWLQLFDEDLEPEWAQIDTRNVRVERARDFGGAWLALHLMGILGLNRLFWEILAPSRAEVCWQAMVMVLIACRLCSPSSELHIANCLYERTALEDLLGLPCDLVNDDRLYRSLDKLLEHKEALEMHLKERLGTLFGLSYDLLLYDVTSTFIEGAGAGNEQMQRGYSRDQRPDCKQVCIALVVSRCGMPLGYELFDGNRSDVSTVEEIVTLMEKRYGAADRIWVMDRGMVSRKNIEFLRKGNRRYILGASRASLKAFEKQLREGDWATIREGLQVKQCAAPDETDFKGSTLSSAEGKEVFILCRSEDRRLKEKAIHEKFETRIEEELTKICETCVKKKRAAAQVERRVGALLGEYSRAARLFQVRVKGRDDGGCDVTWEKLEAQREWSELSEGCYLLRTNITDWTAEDLWKAYIQLTEAENAFRIQKSDLQLRPIWHQKKERVQAHILVCFLAYALWKTFGQLCKRAGLGDEPRQIFDELSQIKMVDVVMKTTTGVEIRRRCIADPDKHQKVLLDLLRLRLPRQMRIAKM